ncbi:hypothetical protein COO60DRAFT_509009 [Scenedesmus sp. NREL 46B-D3]|nr:hypothetical protein COO60DRAFT_509009 [Scenedesmus sp. NREL 46B-D3]
MRAFYTGASLLLLLVCLPCIFCAEGLMNDGSAESAACSSGVPAGEPWWTSAQQSSIQCLQLQQKSCLHDVTHSREVLSTTWVVLRAVIAASLVVSLAVNVRQKRQRAADLARYRAQEQADDARFRGLQRQACEIGKRAVKWANLSNALGEHNKQLAQQLQAANKQQPQQSAQVAGSTSPVSRSDRECQTGNDLGVVLAPTSPKLVGEVASPRGEAPQLQGEASLPQLQDLVAATHSDAAICINDQYNAGTAAAAASSGSGMKGSSPSKLQLQGVPVQGPVQLVAHARSSPLATNDKAASAEQQQQLAAPLAGAAVQQQALGAQSLRSIDGGSDKRSSKFVTQEQLSMALRELFSGLKEEFGTLTSEVKVMQQQLQQQQQQQQSPAVTPLVPSSGYVNTVRGGAGTPSPYRHAFTGQLGAGPGFATPGSAFPPPSALGASGAAASSSSFKGLHAPGQYAPGSAASSASRMTVAPLPMQALESAGSPAGKPSPVQQQQRHGPSAAKALAEAISRALAKQTQEYEAAESRRKAKEGKGTDGLARA